MKTKLTTLLMLSAVFMMAVLFQACSTDSGPEDLNIESMTVGGMDLNAAESPDDVPADASIEVTFSSNVQAATATSANIMLVQDYNDEQIPLDISVSGATITITPQENLGSGALYQLTLSSGLLNEDDQPLANTTRSFTTAGTFSPPGMVAYWTFENSPDDVVGPYVADAEIDIAYEASRNEAAGMAATFNGNTSIIEVPNADALIDAEDFTLSFWVKTDSQGHVNENGDPTGHFVLGLGAQHGIQYEMFGNYEGAKFAISYGLSDGNTAIEDMWFPSNADVNGWQGWTYARSIEPNQMVSMLKDTWLHVTYTYDGMEKEASLYYNGELMKSFDFDLWPDGDAKRDVVGLQYAGSAPDVINDLVFGFIHSREGTQWDNEPWGGYDFPTAQHFQGQLDDVKFYHKALTETEIQLMYDSES